MREITGGMDTRCMYCKELLIDGDTVVQDAGGMFRGEIAHDTCHVSWCKKLDEKVAQQRRGTTE